LRFNFWRNLVASVYEGRPVNHHVATALAESLQAGSPLSKQFLLRILSAREADFTSKSLYPTIDALEQYTENTQSSILYLQLEASGIRDFKVDHVASHIGKAVGLTTLLRGTPFHLAHRTLYFPSELMAKHRLSTEDLFRGNLNPQATSDVVFEIASLANNHIATARAHVKEYKEKGQFPAAAVPALLPAVACDLYLKKLERVNFDLFDKRLLGREWRLLYQLWKRNRAGMI
ncbi:isoprenoid synthase domain-containing protein, partial [Chytriomyces sp. MP71]